MATTQQENQIAERVEAAKIKAEKDQLERAEQGRIAVLKGVADKEAERLRLEALKPDIDKIQDWCKRVTSIELPEIKNTFLSQKTDETSEKIAGITNGLMEYL